MFTSKILNTISALSLQLQCCQYGYDIKQKYCIFFSPKAFCDAQKVLKRRWCELMTIPDPLVGWGGETPLPNSDPSSTPSASRYQRLRRVTSVNSVRIFCAYGPAPKNMATTRTVYNELTVGPYGKLGNVVANYSRHYGSTVCRR